MDVQVRIRDSLVGERVRIVNAAWSRA